MYLLIFLVPHLEHMPRVENFSIKRLSGQSNDMYY